ncbi:UNVERIFIED_CONTAM: hypothetical protein Slati_0989100 [Sesamum latifolium]|uniref:Uncharacterized protein n=1 Tax=Sesamum latifolium TaxID=2727402 RepID=A0AAW2XQQ2_9LAMI
MEQQMRLAAVGGKNKSRVFGLGSEAHFSSRTYTSPLEEMMADMTVMMREMWASSSTATPSQPTASSGRPSTASTAPTDPQPPNYNEMGGLD